jgi:iron complex outermembrane receptor protein
MWIFSTTAYSQLDSLQQLPEVIISDVSLTDFSTGTTTTTLKDSVFYNQTTPLQQTLLYNSLIYFKENGPGGVSSPSFRGTNASQTAVLWNGISINSQLNGQTDFNTISTRNYDNLVVRHGGGSIPYGSGAVGGSIHLNNTSKYNTGFKTKLVEGYGSFDTYSAQAKLSYGTDTFYIETALDGLQSENDFEYLGTNLKNDNGAFKHINGNLNFGFKLSNHHYLNIYHNTFLSDREFSRTLTAVTFDGYQDENTRSLLAWTAKGNNYQSIIRFAHVFESYKYFPDKNVNDFYFYGKAIKYVFNNEFKYQFNTKTSLKTIADFNTTSAEGSNIEESARDVFSGTVLLEHKLSKFITGTVQLKQEISNDYESPLLYGFSGEYHSANTKENTIRQFSLGLNASKNFRAPTFNDLNWNGAGAIGNPDLLPETTYQTELNQTLKFSFGTFKLAEFLSYSENLIQWLPNQQGLFMPNNIKDSRNYGIEAQFQTHFKFGSHKLTATTGYTYVEAKDLSTNAQFIYVPKHKIIGSLGYTYKSLQLIYQLLYNGEVFTKTDNSETLGGYAVSNVNLSYKPKAKNFDWLTVQFSVNNIFNKNYQNIAFRPNPGRHFSILLTQSF